MPYCPARYSYFLIGVRLTGKSFFAGCIVNALLDLDVPVLMTNFPTILNRKSD